MSEVKRTEGVRWVDLSCGKFSIGTDGDTFQFSDDNPIDQQGLLGFNKSDLPDLFACVDALKREVENESL